MRNFSNLAESHRNSIPAAIFKESVRLSRKPREIRQCPYCAQQSGDFGDDAPADFVSVCGRFAYIDASGRHARRL